MYEANFEQPPKKQPALPPQPQELPPLLPAHIEETIRSIARLHAEHHQNATQRAVDRITALLGRPQFIGVLTVIAAGWISLNLLAAALGYRPIDPPPFPGLGLVVSLVSLYIVVLILPTQRREYQLAQTYGIRKENGA
jgi:uncharacterized membrane protein